MTGPAPNRTADRTADPAGDPGAQLSQVPGETRPPGETPAGEQAAPELTPAELEDRWHRAVAEQDNMRKRYERQLADLRRAEQARTASVWLPVLDNLELALRHAGADPNAIVAGVEAVREQALAVLADLGLTRFDDIGARFDPSRHEAAAVIDSTDAAPGTVVAVLRPGYLATDRLVRPAVVAVARKRE